MVVGSSPEQSLIIAKLCIKSLLGALVTLLSNPKQPLEVFCKNGVLKIFEDFTGKQLCWSLFLIKLQALQALTQMFYCEICKIFENTYFEEHLRTAASE